MIQRLRKDRKKRKKTIDIPAHYFPRCPVHLSPCRRREAFVHHQVCFGSKMILPEENYMDSPASSCCLSCQEINHAPASPRSQGQQSLHVWESRLATLCCLKMKEVGVGDWQKGFEGRSCEHGGGRAIHSATPNDSARERVSEHNAERKTPSRCCNYSNAGEWCTLGLLLFVESEFGQ